MNISPFCILPSKETTLSWARDVKDLYNAWAGDEEDLELSYLPDKEASVRETYPTTVMKDNELLTTRPQVIILYINFVRRVFIPERQELQSF